jgi:signal transduction histidine kinase
MFKKSFSKNINHPFLFVITILFLLWNSVVVVLGIWWGSLLIKQAEYIETLERQLNLKNTFYYSVQKIHRMILWESSAFFILLLGTSILVSWIIYQEIKRTKSIQAFFASFTHELKTPLTSIRLQAESISEKMEEKNKKNIERLLEDVMRLESQVVKILELSRLEGGGKLYLQPINLQNFIEQLVSKYNRELSHRVIFKTILNNTYVEADSVALEMILNNVIENSLRHSNKNLVEITIELKPLSDNKALLSIRDNGEVNYENEFLSKLGKLFVKGKFSQGSGLGLYIISRLMKQMNGSAEFYNDFGFIVNLVFKKVEFKYE